MMVSPGEPDECGFSISVKDENRSITGVDGLFIVLNVYIRPATVFGRADNRRIVR